MTAAESLDWADLEAAGLHIPIEYQPRVALALRMASDKYRVVGLRDAASITTTSAEMTYSAWKLEHGELAAATVTLLKWFGDEIAAALMAAADKLERGEL